MKKTVNPGHRKGIVQIPASKSDGQRAFLAAALAKGTSVLKGTGNSDDELAILETVRQLGAEITASGKELTISGIADFPREASISAGESGLGIRLTGMVCAAHEGIFTINGTGSLLSRPMDFFEEVLPKLGATGKTSNGKLPLVISGPLTGGELEVDGSLSSQFISGMLMALPLAKNDSILKVNNLKSAPYVNMTLKTLKAFGITVENENLEVFRIPGNQAYQPADYTIDADWSSASCWLVASALGHDLAISGLSLSSLQADKALLSFFLAADCKVVRGEEGISIHGLGRTAFSVDATDCPDLFPALTTLAAFCEGTSRIRGVSRLAHKESNRGLALQSEFGRLGVKIDLDGDEMLIHGTGKVGGGTVHSHHDHRIAMCLAVAGLSAGKEVIIEDAEAVSKSYPAFWEVLEKL